MSTFKTAKHRTIGEAEPIESGVCPFCKFPVHGADDEGVRKHITDVCPVARANPSWVDTDTEVTACCAAQASYTEDVLVCKNCYREVEWR